MPEILHKFTSLRITWLPHDTSLPDRGVIHPISQSWNNQATDFHVQCPALTLSRWTRPCELDAYFWDVPLGFNRWMPGHCHNHSATSSTPSIVKCKASTTPVHFPSHSFIFSTALPACFGPSSPYRHESHAASTHLETNDNWSPAFFVEAVPDASCDTNDQGKCYPYRFSSQPSIPPSLPKFNKRLPALASGDHYFKLPNFGKWHAPGLH